MRQKKNKLVIYKDKKRAFRWRCVAPNGNILADGGEGYKTRRSCLGGLESVFNKPGTIVDITRAMPKDSFFHLIKKPRALAGMVLPKKKR